MVPNPLACCLVVAKVDGDRVCCGDWHMRIARFQSYFTITMNSMLSDGVLFFYVSFGTAQVPM
tara:strand:+ start:40 stop:228 length:189 start_codon:yes stop_codon:yes gene_type:complete